MGTLLRGENMKEIFKDIPEYEGLYQVSNLGRVIGLKRETILKFDISSHAHTSYARVTLCKDGETTRYLVHRLVATAFIENPTGKPHVNHIDNNGLNNFCENLEWCTASENMQHSANQGRQKLAQARATSAAILVNYARYIAVWRDKLGERFLTYYAPHEVKQHGSKQTAAIQYICGCCNLPRLSLTSWAELTKHNGICPNCTYSLELLDKDIV